MLRTAAMARLSPKLTACLEGLTLPDDVGISTDIDPTNLL